MIRTRLALAFALVASAAMVTPAAAQYNDRVKAKAPFRADAWGPKQGRPGTRCWVDGAGFRKNMTVLVGGRQVRLAKFAPQRIEFDIPRSGYGDGRIVLRRRGHSDVIVGNFAVTPDPAIARFGPHSGLAGTSVEIRGTGFGPGLRVMMNGRPVRADQINPNRIVFRVPGWAKSDYIELVGDGYKIRTRRPFQVLTPAPVIRSLSPAGGAYGTTVRISGQHFDGSEQVFYGRREIRGLRRGAGWVEFSVPNWAKRPRRIRVRNQYGESTWGQPFGLSFPSPVIRSISPAGGGYGTTVRISGEHFDGSEEVFYGPREIRNLRRGSGWVEFSVPNWAQRPRRIRVRNQYGDSTWGQPFGLALPGPVIRSISPAGGGYGTTVRISGQHFDGSEQVFYGSREIRNLRRGNGWCEFSLPDWVKQPRRIRVRNKYGESAWERPFALAMAPVIQSWGPKAGKWGTVVTLRGEHFGRRAEVFYGDRRLRPRSARRGEIEVEVPRGLGPQKFRVVTRAGDAWTGRPFGIHVYPEVSGINPRWGGPGTEVSIRGRALRQAGGWFLGKTPLQVVRSTPREVVVRIPRGARSAKLWWNAHGSRHGGSIDFDVRYGPTVSGFEPAFGPPGTLVTIRGEHLGGPDARVTWGPRKRLRVVKAGPGWITVEVPRRAREDQYLFVEHYGQKIRSANQFRLAFPPEIDKVWPRQIGYGQSLNIGGGGYGRNPVVRIGKRNARILSRKRGQLIVEVPGDVAPGDRWVWVTAGGTTVKSPYPINVRAPAIVSRLTPPRTWRGHTFVVHGEGFGPKVRVRVDGKWWPIKRIGNRGRRIWVDVPNDAPYRGQYWVEVVKAGGFVARSPGKLTLTTPPGSNVRDKRGNKRRDNRRRRRGRGR